MAKERDIVATLIEATKRGKQWTPDEHNWYLSHANCEFRLSSDSGSLTVWFRYGNQTPAEYIGSEYTQPLVELLQDRQPLLKRPDREKILRDAYDSLAATQKTAV